jgi:hypothetical protein
MSILEVDLAAYLTAQAAITAIVPPAQLYPSFIRSDAAFPCISITTVGRTQEVTLNGTLIVMKRVQIDSFAMTFMTAKLLEAAVDAALNGFVGTLQSGSSIRVMICQSEMCVDNWDSDSSVFRVMQVFEIHFTGTGGS